MDYSKNFSCIYEDILSIIFVVLFIDFISDDYIYVGGFFDGVMVSEFCKSFLIYFY